MASCECCWADRWLGDDYYRVMTEHEKAGCVCTKATLAGLVARAGQFWDGKKDRRYDDKQWAALVEQTLDRSKPTTESIAVQKEP